MQFRPSRFLLGAVVVAGVGVGFIGAFEIASLDALNDPEGLKRLIFSIDYDDGYVVYLNGTRVLVTNMRDPEHPTYFDTRSRTARRNEKTLEDQDFAEWKNLLREGTNMLAVSVHNATVRSNDFRFRAQLVSGEFVNEDGPNDHFTEAAVLRRDEMFR